MKKSVRLKPVAKIASHHERKAAMELGLARKDLAEKKIKHEELRTYKLEYIAQFEQQGRHLMTSDKLQNYQTFLDGLGQAIEQQMKLITESEGLVAYRLSIWRERHTKVKMLESITNRYVIAESAHENKLAQKELDELGQGVHQNIKNIK